MERREIYLDNAATTACYDTVYEKMKAPMLVEYGNPSAKHMKGVQAERYLLQATGDIARAFKVKDSEIFYTSGGTESDNWAIIGTALARCRRGKHIITTAMEHPAVSKSMEHLESQGFEVSYISPDSKGNISAGDVYQALRPDTILVSTMHVNNEIGAIVPVAKIGQMLKRECPEVYYHVDAVQSFGKLELYPGRMDIDMASLSAHKLHGPKGTGLLYIRKGVRINPLILGGGQQNGFRSGTIPVSSIVGMAEAITRSLSDMDTKNENMYRIRNYMAGELSKLPDVHINGSVDKKASPHILSVAFCGVKSEVLLHALEEEGIYVSSGSACASKKKSSSPTLEAIGATPDIMDSTIRFSFSEFTVMDDIYVVLEVLNKLLPVLRKFKSY